MEVHTKSDDYMWNRFICAHAARSAQAAISSTHSPPSYSPPLPTTMPGHYVHTILVAGVVNGHIAVPMPGDEFDEDQGPLFLLFMNIDTPFTHIPKRLKTWFCTYLSGLLSACVRGTILLCSTAAHDLNLYEVYYSHDKWVYPIVSHTWSYVGRVHEVFGLRRRRPRRSINEATIRRIVGPYEEAYIFANYDGGVDLYARHSDDLPTNLFQVRGFFLYSCQTSIPQPILQLCRNSIA